MSELWWTAIIVAVVFFAVGFAAGVAWQMRRYVNSEYAKMKREFDEMKQRVRASIDKGRERML